jgi:DNA-binding MarR family transcriptional regulator
MSESAQANDGAPLKQPTVDFLLAWQALEGASRRAREEFARRAGVSVIDYQALVFLSAGSGRPSKAVGEAFHLSSGAVTALVDRLEEAGYVTREPHPTDRRSSLLVLTPSGAEAAAGAGALYVRATESTIPADRLAEATAMFWALARALEGGG